MASSLGTVIFSSLKTEVYNPKTVFPHAASLHQGFPHCAISPTAASRRSLGRVSVPMWPFNLSVRLLIVDLVSRYLTNYLIRREAISERNTLIAKSCGFAMLCGITIRFQKLSHSQRQVPHVLLTRPPLRKYQYSIIGRFSLNHRVRDVDGCFPKAHRHRKFEHLARYFRA